MRLTKTFWLVLVAAILIAAGITLYMLYQGQMREQDKLNDSLAGTNNKIVLLDIEKGALQNEIEQLEIYLVELEGDTDELEAEISQLEAELDRLEEERAQAVAQAIAMLNQAEAKFLSSVESIEYDEILFGFANDANINMTQITTSGPLEQDVDGITYNTTTFTISVWGDVAEIFDFIDTVVAYESFNTAVLYSFNMNVPEPMTDADIAELEQSVREQLTATAIAEITTEEMVGFIVEAVAEVTGPASDWPEEIDTNTIEEMAQLIKEKLDAMIEEEFFDLLSEGLASLIEQNIAGSLVGAVVGPLADQIAALIVSGEADLVELVGDDIARLLGEGVIGSLPGDIAGFLNGYISALIDEKIMDSVDGIVESQIDTIVADIVEGAGVTSSNMTLVIYTYEGE